MKDNTKNLKDQIRRKILKNGRKSSRKLQNLKKNVRRSSKREDWKFEVRSTNKLQPSIYQRPK